MKHSPFQEVPFTEIFNFHLEGDPPFQKEIKNFNTLVLDSKKTEIVIHYWKGLSSVVKHKERHYFT